jgi:hypothetical protein
VVGEGLPPDPSSTGAHTIDGHRIAVYGRHALETRAIDSKGVLRATTQTFLATDIKGYDAILGIPWMIAANPDFLWAECK